ncbi:MAG: hydroxymethylbilane synthase [Ardenticatenaceae bacterium]|nr:hydroxymethylbilane synthase [Ardenticatenaceae bacterium]
MSKTTIVIGTRTSKLALWQTNHVKQQLERRWPGVVCRLEPFVTQGDKTLDRPLPQIGGKGLFTAELEDALRNGRIDLAVHSLKDLPIEDGPGLTLGAIGSRADVRDVLIAPHGLTLATLPQGAVVGTSSLRRQAQLLAHRPDLQVRSIRGNVDTRIGKVMAGEYEAAVLAGAGVTRLGLDDCISEWLPLEMMLPAPGQGALAVQCRADDSATLELLAAIDEAVTRACVTAERAFLGGLGGGCSLPVGAYAQMRDDGIYLAGLVAADSGKSVIRVVGNGRNPQQLGTDLAEEALAEGAEVLLHG